MLRSDIKIDLFSATDHLRYWREITDGLPVRDSAPGAADAGDTGSDCRPFKCVREEDSCALYARKTIRPEKDQSVNRETDVRTDRRTGRQTDR